MEVGAGKRSGSGSNIFYSFDLGLTHFISFSAEAYTYRSGAELLANQLAFMAADLAAVDRAVTPWVVALVHKDWNMEGEAYAAFYPILDAGKVDALFCGHIQCVRRGWRSCQCLAGGCARAPHLHHPLTHTHPRRTRFPLPVPLFLTLFLQLLQCVSAPLCPSLPAAHTAPRLHPSPDHPLPRPRRPQHALRRGHPRD